jgi:uncharacterized membrane protein
MGDEYSGFAIAAFIFGITSLLLNLMPVLFLNISFGLLAIIFGLFAYFRLKKNNKFKGKGLAIAGIIMALVSILAYILLFYLALGNFNTGGFL